MSGKKFRWWHGMMFYVGVQLAQIAIRSAVRAARGSRDEELSPPASNDQDRELYRSQRLPIFAPPPIAFPIAWSINSISLIAGGLHVLNLPAETAGRAEFLRLQGTAWGLFTLFNTAYFELRSPINAVLVTFAYSAATVASLAIAQAKIKDRRAILSLATTIAWLALANPVAVAQATWNYDPFWHVGPFMMPPRGWEKSSK
jgi:translocator protein